jgi:hypothetical protein
MRSGQQDVVTAAVGIVLLALIAVIRHILFVLTPAASVLG